MYKVVKFRENIIIQFLCIPMKCYEKYPLWETGLFCILLRVYYFTHLFLSLSTILNPLLSLFIVFHFIVSLPAAFSFQFVLLSVSCFFYRRVSLPIWLQWTKYQREPMIKTDTVMCCQVSCNLVRKKTAFAGHSFLYIRSDPHSRVALFLKFGVGNSDYINANYIRVSVICMQS